MKPPSPAYLPHIDGLRAFAVLSVLLFHARVPGFSGGYIGVDTFFAISGYLITRIIIGEAAAGRFSYRGFYERRLRRIFPAMAVVMLACLPLAWLLLSPDRVVGFAKSVLATLAFVPNLYFWRTTNYFGESAELSPLLHTWSLGVEEQFYFLAPTLLATWWATRQGLALAAVGTVSVLSLGFAEYAWRHGLYSANFFLPVTRAWELGLGCLLACAQQRHLLARVTATTANGVTALGLLVLAASVVWLDAGSPTPGLLTLAPLGATLAIIAVGQQATWGAWLLTWRPVVTVGLMSYSLYLWHQPVLAFARARWGLDDWRVAALGIAASPLLAWLSWRFVETPFRSRRTVSTRALLLVSAAGAVVLVGAALLMIGNQGGLHRYTPGQQALMAEADRATNARYVSEAFTAATRLFDDLPARRVLVVGDSHAYDLFNTLQGSPLVAAAQVRTFHVPPQCGLYFGSRDLSAHVQTVHRPHCRDLMASPLLKAQLDQAELVLLVSSWQAWSADAVDLTVQALRTRTQARVAVFGPKWIGAVDPLALGALDDAARAAHRFPEHPRIADLERRLTTRLGDTPFFSMQQQVCGLRGACPAFTPEGRLVSFDRDHLTAAGAAAAATRLWADPRFLALWQGRRP